MFSSRMNQSSLLFGPLEELQELAFIERPIRRSLKVCSAGRQVKLRETCEGEEDEGEEGDV